FTDDDSEIDDTSDEDRTVNAQDSTNSDEEGKDLQETDDDEEIQDSDGAVRTVTVQKPAENPRLTAETYSSQAGRW
ncbi:MAG: hypothetical protein SXQ77_11670, partial [Halobacteria archaeon]|nr:hypothetical protein [Halobacteria archaeon]